VRKRREGREKGRTETAAEDGGDADCRRGRRRGGESLGALPADGEGGFVRDYEEEKETVSNFALRP
jgi:hypothetical protein